MSVTASAPHCISLPLSGSKRQQDRARERDEGDDGQDGVVDVHRWFIVSIGASRKRRSVRMKQQDALVHTRWNGRRS